MRLPVTQAGRWAANVLRASVPGRVAHVFERCFYLVNNRGEMARVGEPAIGAGPLNVLLARHRPAPSWRGLLQPGQPYTICGLLLALHALGRPSAAQAVSHWALPLARHRSSHLSVAHLSAAAKFKAQWDALPSARMPSW